MIQASHLSKTYRDFAAVKDLSFSVPRGSCFGLLGPNGAGKSTVIKMIYGAISRSGGSLQVLGIDPQANYRSLRRRLGVVTQDNALDEEMSVRENMLLFGRFHSMAQNTAASRVDELLEYMELSHKASSRIETLSGGMKRRLVFVRALLAKPEILILDEPTTGLDPNVRHLLWERVRELRAAGTTILLTTHYMEEAQHLCDELLIIDDGAIRAAGSPRSLIETHQTGYVGFYEAGGEVTRVEDVSLEALAARIRALGATPTMIRPGNLEDVFLKVTGKGLCEHA